MDKHNTNENHFSKSIDTSSDNNDENINTAKTFEMHIYILPRNFWKTDQNLAYNETIKESVSLGFIRASRDMHLKDVRKEIQKQCNSAEIPKKYSFLKSVGRAFTQVKEKQENELKIKHFLPFQEIFLLEKNEYDRNQNLSKLFNYPTTSPDKIHREDSNSDKRSMASNYNRYPPDSKQREHERLKDEQERLRLRQEELENMRNKHMRNGDHSNGNTSRKNLSPLKEFDNSYHQPHNSRQSIYKSPIAIRDADDYQIKPQNNHNDSDYLKVPNQLNKKNSNSNNSLNGDGRSNSKNPPKNLSNHNGYDDDNYSPRNNASQLLPRNPDLEFPDDAYENGYEDNDVDDLPTSRLYQDKTKNQPPNINNGTNNNNSKPTTNGIPNKTQNTNGIKPVSNKEKVDPAKMRDPRMSKSLEENNAGNYDQDYENGVNTIKSLTENLKLTKKKRLELEFLRDELIKHLKQIHNRITVRRKEARDLWKKKYFTEKKKTPALEEKVQELLNEIEGHQKKINQALETDIKVAANEGYKAESEMKSEWLTSYKLQEENYLLKRQVDQYKLKLTTDIKLRNQAETETKALKTELFQTKLNINQLKNNTFVS